MLTTQLYSSDDPKNASDRILNSVEDKKAREMLISEYKPIPGSKTGELAVNFDVVIGLTAVFAARWVMDPKKRGLAIGWNVLGILLLL